MGIADRLREIRGLTVLTEKEDLIPYTRDASYFEGSLPDAVVIPSRAKEVADVLKICNDMRVPVTVRGGGSSLTGSSVPSGGGVVINMLSMNRILEVRPSDNYAIVEPGVRLDDLNRSLQKLGFFYPPDPASSMAATVGGTIATNAGGLRATAYGTTKEWILGLEVVLPTGEIIETGSLTLKRSIGYDLTALMVGSEGTLGVITKAILKIWPLPEVTGRIISFFKEIESAGAVIAELKRSGIVPYIAEFMDKISLDSIKETRGIGYPEGAEYLLLVDVASTAESIDRLLRDSEKIVRLFGPISVTVTKDAGEMERMYEARKGLYSSILSQRDNPNQYVVIGDIVVPASRLPDTLKGVREASTRSGLKVALFGHIGDGNIHANIFADMSNEDVRKRVNGFQESIAAIALSNGGCISAEHGIGMEKKDLLRIELERRDSRYSAELMKRIKLTFDPNEILGRGKIFD
ncbi:MAG: FAD-binding oxidoreductase [Thermoplasmatales archaeon]